ncbi:MAG TPA: hypothetical protein VHA56_01070 [Mucilaginibacter sp.]|nr:hypothetical protein [Mucilaginibacter sp.]
MKKTVIIISCLIVAVIACFIPVTKSKTIPVKSSFLNVYRLLTTPGKWVKWHPILREIPAADSSKILLKKNSAAFSVKYQDLNLDVDYKGGDIVVNEQFNGHDNNYSYTLAPDKRPDDTTFVTATKKTSLFSYLLGRIGSDSFSDTRINDLKRYMETDSLRYGCNIAKTKVPGSDLIVVKKKVLTLDKFKAAADIYSELKQFASANNVKPIQPVIAQFIPAGKDSTQVNIGLFIDKPVKGTKDIFYNHMPKGGPLYAAKFSGKFQDRGTVYAGLHQYFIDHLYQMAILPFESYLDDKLPVSDTSKVNIQIDFSTYF